MENTANTPTRAIAISTPIAIAISLPLNHFAMAFDTVVPAISHPHPKIMNPNDAILALPGMDVHHVLSHAQKSVVWNHSEMPTNFIRAPMTMSEPERRPVNLIPVLSRMKPARIRNPQMLRKYSELEYVP